MKINENSESKTLEDFVEEDLPFLLESHYEATINLVKQQLETANLSLDSILAEYPNFLTKIQYHLFFLFAHQMNTTEFEQNVSLHERYFIIAAAYRHQYINYFVAQQIQAIDLKSK